MYFLDKITNKEAAYQRINYYYNIIDTRDRSDEEHEREPDLFCEHHFHLSLWSILDDLDWTECFLDQHSVVAHIFQQRLAYIRHFLCAHNYCIYPRCAEYSKLITDHPEILVLLGNFQNSLNVLLKESYSLFEEFEILVPKSDSFPRKTFFVVRIEIWSGSASDHFYELKGRHVKPYVFSLYYDSQHESVGTQYVSFCPFHDEPHITVTSSHENPIEFDVRDDDEKVELMHISFLTHLYLSYTDLKDNGPVYAHEYLYQKLHGTERILASDFILS